MYMNGKILFTVILCFLLIGKSYSQNQFDSVRYFGIEVGNTFLSFNIPDYSFIRADNSSNNNDNSAINLTGRYNEFQFSIKTETRSLKNKLGLLYGIRLTYIASSLGKQDIWSKNDKYFYLLVNQSNTSSEILRVNEISQNSYFIGIPLELRYFTSHNRFFRFYFKTSVDLSYKFFTKNDVIYYNDNMESYTTDVISKFDKPNPFHCNINFGAGIKLGKEGKFNINMEAFAVSFNIVKTNSSIVRTGIGGGMQVNLLIPLKF